MYKHQLFSEHVYDKKLNDVKFRVARTHAFPRVVTEFEKRSNLDVTTFCGIIVPFALLPENLKEIADEIRPLLQYVERVHVGSEWSPVQCGMATAKYSGWIL